MRIGVDLMGSDNSPYVLFDAVLQARALLDSNSVIVVIATHAVVSELKSRYPQISQVEFHQVSNVIAMHDDPLSVARRKKGSSIGTGIALLKKKYLDAFISAGNTGALLTSATLQLPALPGIKRSALLAVLPTVTGTVAVLDIGGNVSCKAHHLVQFACMGAAFQSCYSGIELPSVGLLNIGEEARKGTSIVRQAYQVLSNSESLPIKMNFLGNVEGREVFQGGVDVLVTDGFAGNVLLKTSEGVSSFIFEYMQDVLQESSSEKLHQTFQQLKGYFSYAENPGAILCGVEGLVVKCHGNSPPKAIYNAIQGAIHLVNRQLISNLKNALARCVDKN